MDNTNHARQIAFHAMIVLTLGMVSGFIWGSVMSDPTETLSRAAAWRLAHIEGFANGVLMLGIALSYALVQPQGLNEKIIRYGIIVTGYSNMVATIYGGIFDGRGLMPSAASSTADLVVFYAFLPGVIGIFGVLVAMAISLRGKK